MLCFELILSQFCRYAQKLSRRAKTFRSAMPTRRRGFSDSASRAVRIFFSNLWGFLLSQRVKMKPAIGGEKAVLSPQSSILSLHSSVLGPQFLVFSPLQSKCKISLKHWDNSKIFQKSSSDWTGWICVCLYICCCIYICIYMSSWNLFDQYW